MEAKYMVRIANADWSTSGHDCYDDYYQFLVYEGEDGKLRLEANPMPNTVFIRNVDALKECLMRGESRYEEDPFKYVIEPYALQSRFVISAEEALRRAGLGESVEKKSLLKKLFGKGSS